MDDDEAESVVSETGPTSILNLPVELLVYIIHFLPTVRDKVKLRYVSRTLRVASETPSLWREFVWPLYDRREERSAINVLKACGDYIKRLMFPDHVPPTSLIEMLSHCKNVTQLSLPPGTKIDSEELRLAVQHMEHLEKLEVQLSPAIKPLLQISGLKELTIHVPEALYSRCFPWIQEWMMKGYVPPKLNVVTRFLFIKFLLSEAAVRMPPVGHRSCLKLYYSDVKVPLNLFPTLPHFQLDFGENTIYPYTKIGTFGITDLQYSDFTLVTDCEYGSKALIVRPIDFGIIHNYMLNKNVSNLNSITEFDLSYGRLNSEHLEQLAIACPNLQRLNLFDNNVCLSSLKGLQMIAQRCCNLCGLNLGRVSITEVEDQMRLWQILSDMRLTHLVLEVCVFQPGVVDESYELKLIDLFQRCYSLQALELLLNQSCKGCEERQVKRSLLPKFQELKYCYCYINDSSFLQDIVESCKALCCLRFHSTMQLSLSSAYNSNLQQLCIDAQATALPDIFMETVSAHGELVHVVLFALVVTTKGITSLIENSSNLITLVISSRFNDKSKSIPQLMIILKKRFSYRKLINVGKLRLNSICHPPNLNKVLCETDLVSLWCV